MKDKRTKAELLERIKLYESEERMMCDKINELERHVNHEHANTKKAESETKAARDVLGKIRIAVETAATMRFPDVDMTGTNQVWHNGQMINLDQHDSEELRLLRYLYHLSSH